MFTYFGNTQRNNRIQAVSVFSRMHINTHTHPDTSRICVQPSRQQEGETLLPVEEWMEGVLVTLSVPDCMCVYWGYMCAFLL